MRTVCISVYGSVLEIVWGNPHDVIPRQTLDPHRVYWRKTYFKEQSECKRIAVLCTHFLSCLKLKDRTTNVTFLIYWDKWRFHGKRDDPSVWLSILTYEDILISWRYFGCGGLYVRTECWYVWALCAQYYRVQNQSTTDITQRHREDVTPYIWKGHAWLMRWKWMQMEIKYCSGMGRWPKHLIHWTQTSRHRRMTEHPQSVWYDEQL
jgi:hypothetical protein